MSKVKAISRLTSGHEYILITRQEISTTIDVEVSDDFKQEFIEELEKVLKALKGETDGR